MIDRERKKERQSNIELLRIVSMLLVLLCHFVPTRYNGVFSTSNVPQGLNPLDTDLQNTITNLELRSLSIVCTHCFLLISGYFGIKFKIKSLANLIFQMLFWCIVCIAIAVIIAGNLSPIPSIGTFINTIIYGWFPTGYIILFVLSPILNSFINSCSEKELGKYIIYFYLLSTIGGYILGFNDFNEGMSTLSMCGLYLIGAYLRTTSLKIFSLKAKYDLLIYLGLGFAMVVLNLILLYFRIYTSPYGYLNPVIIIMAIYLFLFFKKIDIGSNKIINFFSASAFSIYLFHCNIYIGGNISQIWKDINMHFGIFSSIFVGALSFIAIYLFCTLIDQIRIILYNKVICKFL